MGEDGAKQPLCACYKECQEFHKVVELKDTGLVVYCHATRRENVIQGGVIESAISTSQDVFILHNTKDVKIKPADLLPALEKNDISCPRCRKIFKSAQELLEKVTFIDKQNVMGVCDHCRKKAQFKKPCDECNEIVQKFISTRSEQKEDTKQYIKIWLSKMKHLLKNATTTDKHKKVKPRAYSDLHIDRLCRNSPISIREPEVKQMFHFELHKSDSNLYIKATIGDQEQQNMEKSVAFTEAAEPSETPFTNIAEYYDESGIDVKETIKKQHDLNLRHMINLKHEKETEDLHRKSHRPKQFYEIPKIAPWEEQQIQESSKHDESKQKYDLSSRRVTISHSVSRDFESPRTSQKSYQESQKKPGHVSKYYDDSVIDDKATSKKKNSRTSQKGLRKKRGLESYDESTMDVKGATKRKHVIEAERDAQDSEKYNRSKIKRATHETERVPKKIMKREERYLSDDEIKFQRSVSKFSHETEKPGQPVKKTIKSKKPIEPEEPVEKILRPQYSFFFPKGKQAKKIKLEARSSQLIKDTQEKLQEKAEEEKKKQEEEQEKKLEEHEKKRFAREEKKRLAEEQKQLAEEKKQHEEEQKRHAEDTKTRAEEEAQNKILNEKEKKRRDDEREQEKSEDVETKRDKDQKDSVSKVEPKDKGLEDTKKDFKQKTDTKDKRDIETEKTKQGLKGKSGGETEKDKKILKPQPGEKGEIAKVSELTKDSKLKTEPKYNIYKEEDTGKKSLKSKSELKEKSGKVTELTQKQIEKRGRDEQLKQDREEKDRLKQIELIRKEKQDSKKKPDSPTGAEQPSKKKIEANKEKKDSKKLLELSKQKEEPADAKELTNKKQGPHKDADKKKQESAKEKEAVTKGKEKEGVTKGKEKEGATKGKEKEGVTKGKEKEGVTKGKEKEGVSKGKEKEVVTKSKEEKEGITKDKEKEGVSKDKEKASLKKEDISKEEASKLTNASKKGQNAMDEAQFKKLQAELAKQKAEDLKKKNQQEAEEQKAREMADKKAKEDVDSKSKKTVREAKAEIKPEVERPKKEQAKTDKDKMKESDLKELKMNQVKMRRPSTYEDDLILRLVRIRQAAVGEKIKPSDLDPTDIIKTHAQCHHKSGLTSSVCALCIDSELEFDAESYEKKINTLEDMADIIIGEKIFKYKPPLVEKTEEHEVIPMLFQSVFQEESALLPAKIEIMPIISEPEPQKKTMLAAKDTTVVEQESGKGIIRYALSDRTFIDKGWTMLPTEKVVRKVEQESGKGIIRYALSDRTFIDKGWTMLPTEKVVRKMNVYRMRPAHPEFDWFEHNKNKRLMTYDSGEKLADFDDNGRGRWYYKNGRLALDYYDAEEANAQQRFVVYSSGEPDERGRSHPITILATFDYLGNGIVFDHSGKIRLKYNQTEGVVLDRGIGPVSHWKWHTLNDPPVLQQVMIDTQMAHKDPKIIKLGTSADNKVRPDNEEMLAIEFDNFIKEKSKKLTQTFKPFQIKMKAMKINENFSLKVLDQATIYLIFRDGSTNLKLNIGMVLDHQEIVDTDTAEVGEVSNNIERFPARTDSLAGLQRSVAYAQRYERVRTERERRLRPPEPCASADQLTAAASSPLRLPLRTVPTGSTSSAGYCKCRKPTNNLYYNTRLL